MSAVGSTLRDPITAAPAATHHQPEYYRITTATRCGLQEAPLRCQKPVGHQRGRVRSASRWRPPPAPATSIAPNNIHIGHSIEEFVAFLRTCFSAPFQPFSTNLPVAIISQPTMQNQLSFLYRLLMIDYTSENHLLLSDS